MKARTTLYELLGLGPDATEAEIRAAHLMLVERYQSGKHGLPPVDADNRIKAIKEAYWILSEPGRRAAYDASLVHATVAPPPLADGGLPLKVEISDVKWTPGRIMLTIIGGLMIVGMVIQIFFSLFAFKQAGRAASGEMAAEAQERVMAAERRQMYGNMSEAEIAEQERRERQDRVDSASRYEQERQERARRDEERRREEALRERTYYADRVSSDLQHAEQAARQQAEYEKRQKEEAERRAEMEEQRRVQERLSRERARWQQELRN
ncbi:DnaJ domain-containing protein [Zoogloea sp.]|jgi:curved DNA-binding protein CbpA|uniref:J domain-containing protein n=1 Tax=Zoogloea sp. TaxID=49181 RepID=UPI0025F410A1|nr:DnaJ domain-containing protein [Zoogloea sp.]MCK6393527.1 J domain-containing protein [Zoogloea sp.]